MGSLVGFGEEATTRSVVDAAEINRPPGESGRGHRRGSITGEIARNRTRPTGQIGSKLARFVLDTQPVGHTAGDLATRGLDTVTDRSGDRTRDSPRRRRLPHRIPIDTIPMALGHLNPLRRHIRARTQPGTDHRLLTNIDNQTRRRFRS
ncbi:hypothetical protein [Nocardia terpenica]|uniref:hypothetical protein n=1 Tax=Nocardia terpenica TaxID=455432 RepID=UPI002FE0A0A1